MQNCTILYIRLHFAVLNYRTQNRSPIWAKFIRLWLSPHTVEISACNIHPSDSYVLSLLNCHGYMPHFNLLATALPVSGSNKGSLPVLRGWVSRSYYIMACRNFGWSCLLEGSEETHQVQGSFLKYIYQLLHFGAGREDEIIIHP